ncbi:MAG TPA: HAD family hydrolase [Azospirillum sp.]|nr:HAD family hydrolase [Azospirillum sp.]
MAMKALLLDRDGVVNVDHGYVGEVERFAFVDGIFDLTRRAVDRGYRVAVITNQAGIARGYYTEADFQVLTRWMVEAFERRGIPIAAVFYCPYHGIGSVAAYARESFWRKPNPGMILEAQRRFDLDLARSVFVGDQPTDMAAARAAGVGIRVLLAHGATAPVSDANRTVTSLDEVEDLL